METVVVTRPPPLGAGVGGERKEMRRRRLRSTLRARAPYPPPVGGRGRPPACGCARMEGYR
jgi:hypothetical protein